MVAAAAAAVVSAGAAVVAGEPTPDSMLDDCSTVPYQSSPDLAKIFMKVSKFLLGIGTKYYF